MKKPHHNRRFIASLAVEALVPLVEQEGRLCYGNGVHPSYRMLVTHDLKMVVAHGLLADPRADHLCSSLDIWPLGRSKAFSLRWDPFDIVSFRSGDWINTLIEIALERGVDLNASAEPLANLVQEGEARVLYSAVSMPAVSRQGPHPFRSSMRR